MDKKAFLQELLATSEDLLEEVGMLDRKFISGLSKTECDLLEAVRKNVYRAQMILDLAVLSWYEREADDDKGKG